MRDVIKPFHKTQRKTAASTADVTYRCAQQIIELRRFSGETQEQLAQRVGMTKSMISRLERGDHIPSFTTLCRIAEAFSCVLEVAFHEHEHEHPNGVRHTHAHGPGHSNVTHASGDKR